jgi:hypothetical protein
VYGAALMNAAVLYLLSTLHRGSPQSHDTNQASFQQLGTIQSGHSVDRGQQNLAFWARDATARQFSTVRRVVSTTSSDNDSYLFLGSSAPGAIWNNQRFELYDHGSYTDDLLYGAGELDVHKRASVPKQESYHRHYLNGGLSRGPNA